MHTLFPFVDVGFQETKDIVFNSRRVLNVDTETHKLW